MRVATKHAEGQGPRHSADAAIVPINPRDPGAVFIQQEIDADRRRERRLWLKAFVAIALVVGLVVVREVFFV